LDVFGIWWYLVHFWVSQMDFDEFLALDMMI
jgi:hypothetical protein